MISPDVQFLDMDPWHWRRLYDAVFAKKQGRGLTILVRDGRIAKIHGSFVGLQGEWESLDASDPGALARTLYETVRPDWVEVLDVAALRDYGVAVQTMHDWREDADAYLARCFRALHHFPAGLVRYPPWPHELEIAGIAHSALARFVAQVPDGQTLVLGVFEGDEIWACVICRIVSGRIGLIAGSDSFLAEGVHWARWIETYKEFLASVEAAVGEPYFALFCARSVFQQLITEERKWDLLLDSIRRKQAVVYPTVERLSSRERVK